MNWKEEFEKRFGIATDPFQDFIETEIIEKLIEEIPDVIPSPGDYYNEYGKYIKQQLRAKWLGKE